MTLRSVDRVESHIDCCRFPLCRYAPHASLVVSHYNTSAQVANGIQHLSSTIKKKQLHGCGLSHYNDTTVKPGALSNSPYLCIEVLSATVHENSQPTNYGTRCMHTLSLHSTVRREKVAVYPRGPVSTMLPFAQKSCQRQVAGGPLKMLACVVLADDHWRNSSRNSRDGRSGRRTNNWKEAAALGQV